MECSRRVLKLGKIKIETMGFIYNGFSMHFHMSHCNFTFFGPSLISYSKSPLNARRPCIFIFILCIIALIKPPRDKGLVSCLPQVRRESDFISRAFLNAILMVGVVKLYGYTLLIVAWGNGHNTNHMWGTGR